MYFINELEMCTCDLL